MIGKAGGCAATEPASASSMSEGSVTVAGRLTTASPSEGEWDEGGAGRIGVPSQVV